MNFVSQRIARRDSVRITTAAGAALAAGPHDVIFSRNRPGMCLANLATSGKAVWEFVR
jgi:hypothetical protein